MLHRSHQPAEYQCPFCELVQDLPFSQDNLCAPTDLIYQTGLVAAIMACDGFGNYGGHAMIIPTRHLEALYDLDDATGAAIMKETKRVALAMKLAWDPEGTSTRQHNEPAGNQHVWHYHQHVFPRYHDDQLYQQLRHRVSIEERALKAQQLRQALFSPEHPEPLQASEVIR
ncbi:HIT family hydrolase [Glutamicibacter halophytocola]|uniref:HIT family protein n=1 Tax=Glutamicibacter halophytocola TaxID=1933880 RepID=UPI0006D4BBF3|nr:HIT family protein [Glutamicibacter halophytocola]ALG29724.1 HIT family hydrolase [Glutamicibacter halophytocola]NQD40766.1 HIT family protein [Glutamicibacter halophytocola]